MDFLLLRGCRRMVGAEQQTKVSDAKSANLMS
jgi:hypothetical protein